VRQIIELTINFSANDGDFTVNEGVKKQEVRNKSKYQFPSGLDSCILILAYIFICFSIHFRISAPAAIFLLYFISRLILAGVAFYLSAFYDLEAG